MKTLIIVDTLNLLFRSHYAMRNFTNSKGVHTGMLYGLLGFFDRVQNQKPDYVVFALDSTAGSFRKDLLNDYKANRKELDEEIKEQIPICIDVIKKSGFCSIEVEKYEADDVIASITKQALEQGISTKIYSTDKDLYQLINEKVVLIGKDNNIIDELACIEKFGVNPEQMLDYLTLVGDSADNFKGVPGIGPVAAKKILKEYGSLDNAYANLNTMTNKSMQKKLSENKEEAKLSKQLAKLVDDLVIDDVFTKASMPMDNVFANIIDEIKEYEMFKYLPLTKNQIAPKTMLSFRSKSVLIENEAMLEKAMSTIGEKIGFSIDTNNSINEEIIGFSFANEDNDFYVPMRFNSANNLSKAQAIACIKTLFKDHEIIAYDLKNTLKAIKNQLKIDYPKKFNDTLITAWLLNPSNDNSLKNLGQEFAGFNLEEFSLGKNHFLSDVDLEKDFEKLAKKSALSRYIFLKAFNKLDELRQKELDYENEFLKVLIYLEEQGISVNSNTLNELKTKLENELKNLEEQIFAISEEEFNINSPKQLKEILFDKLGLEDLGKGSTNEAVLQELDHPIASLILEYRSAAKVLNTYVVPFLELNTLNEAEFRIHTHFLQTGTSTGRLSSNNPNLQNIPARSKYASSLKQAFVAEQGYSLISIDYSQIELRMLAHFSKDANLLKAFLDNEDIHSNTALRIFGSVDKEKRSYAKSINFGLIYGMGARTLAKELKISFKDASNYLDRYYKSYPTIIDFFANSKKQAKDLGYIQTILGRRRFFKYTNQIFVNNANDRESINSILQGSAADLIKLAMIKIYPLLNNDCRMILQIHDELIFEVKDECVDDFAKKAQSIMENIYSVNVVLKTSLSVGKSWAELK